MKQRDKKAQINALFTKEYHNGWCSYCGATTPYSHYDHFLPMAFLLRCSDEDVCKLKEANLLLLIPCCLECNALLSDIIFKTVQEKRKAIQKKLKDRYSGLLLDKPESRLSEREIINKQYLLARISWDDSEAETCDTSLQKGQKYCSRCKNIFWSRIGIEQFCSERCKIQNQREINKKNLKIVLANTPGLDRPKIRYKKPKQVRVPTGRRLRTSWRRADKI
jgi:hypothetical protein